MRVNKGKVRMEGGLLGAVIGEFISIIGFGP